MHKSRDPKRVRYVAILGAALVLRGLMVLAVAKGDPRSWFFNQASEYGCLAQSMLSGHGYASPFCGSTGPSAFLAPGYPMLAALAFHLFGSYSAHAAIALVALQMVFAGTTVFVLMRLTKRVLGVTAANIAGTLYAVSPPALGLPILFWETSLSMLLLTGALWAAIRCTDHPARRNWIALGVLYAIAMLVNPSLLLTFAATLLWTIWHTRARRYSGPFLALLIWCAVYSVWPVRNYIQLHAFVPLRTNLGYELWQGNRPGSDGTFKFALHPNASTQEYAHYANLGELAFMREKSELAIAAIKADKVRFARLSLERFVKFWLNSTAYRSSRSLSLNIAFTSVMSVVGLALLIRRNASIGSLLAIPFIVLPAPYYLTHADFRFRLLLDPLAMLLTAFVLQECRSFHAAHQERNKAAGEVPSGRLPAST